MSIERKNTCGACQSAVRANTKGMEGMLWCQSGHAARRSGIITIQAVFINPKREACDEGFALRTTPIPDALPVTGIESEPVAPKKLAQNGEDESVPPWDLPEPSRVQVPPPQDLPNKEEAFPSEFFL